VLGEIRDGESHQEAVGKPQSQVFRQNHGPTRENDHVADGPFRKFSFSFGRVHFLWGAEREIVQAGSEICRAKGGA
jgi:hypothetical protein